jgi:hypothetical protein
VPYETAGLASALGFGAFAPDAGEKCIEESLFRRLQFFDCLLPLDTQALAMGDGGPVRLGVLVGGEPFVRADAEVLQNTEGPLSRCPVLGVELLCAHGA